MDIANSPTIIGKQPKSANHERDCPCPTCRPSEWLTLPVVGQTDAVLAERERCAKIADDYAESVGGVFDSATGYAIAAAIRSGK